MPLSPNLTFTGLSCRPLLRFAVSRDASNRIHSPASSSTLLPIAKLLVSCTLRDACKELPRADAADDGIVAAKTSTMEAITDILIRSDQSGLDLGRFPDCWGGISKNVYDAAKKKLICGTISLVSCFSSCRYVDQEMYSELKLF